MFNTINRKNDKLMTELTIYGKIENKPKDILKKTKAKVT